MAIASLVAMESVVLAAPAVKVVSADLVQVGRAALKAIAAPKAKVATRAQHQRSLSQLSTATVS